MLEKLKFNSNSFDRELDLKDIINVRGKLPQGSNNFQNSDIEINTKLRNSESTSKLKQTTKLDTDKDNKGKDYRNFSLKSEKVRETLNHGDYVNNGYKGNGRGFGDVNISQDLRYGKNSRDEKKTARSHDLKDLKFNNLMINFSDEDNVVLPFPRGGIDTRNLEKN
jgi:hypothetical protein|tara:strand:- start:470 stop:967 length:498 start_codon:yes stop_codon:yes gene_type:complete